jgi:hypothetical protein
VEWPAGGFRGRQPAKEKREEEKTTARAVFITYSALYEKLDPTKTPAGQATGLRRLP